MSEKCPLSPDSGRLLWTAPYQYQHNHHGSHSQCLWQELCQGGTEKISWAPCWVGVLQHEKNVFGSAFWPKKKKKKKEVFIGFELIVFSASFTVTKCGRPGSSVSGSKGVSRKIFQEGGVTEKKKRKLAKNIEKWHYLASSKGGGQQKDRKIAKKDEK